MDYKKQALFNTIANVIYLIAQWFLTVIITKISGYEMAGVFSLAMSVGNIFYFIQMYGMRSYQASDASGEFCAVEYIHSRYTTVVIGMAMALGYLAFSGYAGEKLWAIILYTAFRSFEALSDAYFGELQKKGRLELAAISMTAKSVFMVILFAITLHFTKNLNYSLGVLVAEAIAFTFVYDRVQYKKVLQSEEGKLRKGGVKNLLITCFSLMLTTLFPIVVTSLPRVYLDRYYDSELLGYYGNVSTPTVLITAIVPNILIPFMTLYGQWFLERKFRKLLKGFAISIVGTIGLGLVCMLGVFLLGKPVMAILFTKEIVDYVWYLYPLIIEAVIYAFSMCGNSILISMRRNREILVFATVALLTCLFTCSFLVKKYDIMGAIVTMAIAYLAQFICQIVLIVRLLTKKKKDDGEVAA